MQLPALSPAPLSFRGALRQGHRLLHCHSQEVPGLRDRVPFGGAELPFGGMSPLVLPHGEVWMRGLKACWIAWNASSPQRGRPAGDVEGMTRRLETVPHRQSPNSETHWPASGISARQPVLQSTHTSVYGRCDIMKMPHGPGGALQAGRSALRASRDPEAPDTDAETSPAWLSGQARLLPVPREDIDGNGCNPEQALIRGNRNGTDRQLFF